MEAKVAELEALTRENRALKHRTSVLQRAVEGWSQQARGLAWGWAP